MALKSSQNGSDQPIEIEDLLDQLEKLLERLKVMYEQYFMGIQKMAPAQIHNEVERRLRDLTQISIRNTALRYRFNAMQQKFASYNSYWRRTLREIEQGRYVRSLQRLSRQAARDGVALPDEILAAMPQRMREQVMRDREAALAQAKRRGEIAGASSAANNAGAAPVASASPATRDKRDARGNILLSEDDGDLDLDALFGGITDEAPDTIPPPVAAAPTRTPAPPPALARPHNPTAVSPPPVMPRVTKPPPLPQNATRPPPVQPLAKPAPVPVAAAAARQPRAGTELGASASARQPRAATALGTGTAQRTPMPSASSLGMTDAEVRSLYNNYVKAREMVGEKSDASTYAKLMKTIQQQAPKIMEQYKSKGVEFGVVVKGDQVILKAKPK